MKNNIKLPESPLNYSITKFKNWFKDSIIREIKSPNVLNINIKMANNGFQSSTWGQLYVDFESFIETPSETLNLPANANTPRRVILKFVLYRQTNTSPWQMDYYIQSTNALHVSPSGTNTVINAVIKTVENLNQLIDQQNI